MKALFGSLLLYLICASNAYSATGEFEGLDYVFSISASETVYVTEVPNYVFIDTVPGTDVSIFGPRLLWAGTNYHRDVFAYQDLKMPIHIIRNLPDVTYAMPTLCLKDGSSGGFTAAFTGEIVAKPLAAANSQDIAVAYAQQGLNESIVSVLFTVLSFSQKAVTAPLVEQAVIQLYATGLFEFVEANIQEFQDDLGWCP